MVNFFNAVGGIKLGLDDGRPSQIVYQDGVLFITSNYSRYRFSSMSQSCESFFRLQAPIKSHVTITLTKGKMPEIAAKISLSLSDAVYLGVGCVLEKDSEPSQRIYRHFLLIHH